MGGESAVLTPRKAAEFPLGTVVRFARKGARRRYAVAATDQFGRHMLVALSGAWRGYDNALAESVNGLFKTEVIRRCGPWRSFEEVEFATLEWVDWFNNRSLFGPLGYVHQPSTNTSTIVEARAQSRRLDSTSQVSDKSGALQ